MLADLHAGPIEAVDSEEGTLSDSYRLRPGQWGFADGHIDVRVIMNMIDN